MFNSIFEVDAGNLVNSHNTNVIQLSNNSQGDKLSGIKTGEELERVDKIELEKFYITEPLAFNTVNKYVFGVSKRKAWIQSDDDRDAEQVKQINKRLMLQTKVIPHMIKDMCVFGTSWNYILESNDGRVLRLSARDPKYMDISKDGTSGKAYPILDEYEEPRYYVQILEHMQTVGSGWEEIEQLGQRAVKYEKDEILRTNLFTLGDSQEGIGILEPMYTPWKDKRDVERATTQAILRLAYPLIHAMVGNDNMYPTAQVVEEVSEIIHDVNERTSITLPNYVNLKLLESKKPDKLTQNLPYYIDQMVAATGLPNTMVTGAGEGSNKHTLSEMMNFVGGAFIQIQNNIQETMNNQLTPKLMETERGLKGELSFEWEEIGDTLARDGGANDDGGDDIGDVDDIDDVDDEDGEGEEE